MKTNGYKLTLVEMLSGVVADVGGKAYAINLPESSLQMPYGA